jgi:site-specific recombinase XerD
MAPATRSRRRACLRQFYGWAFARDLIAFNPMLVIEKIKVPKRLPTPIPPETADKIIAAIPQDNLRDRLLFTFARETGVRASEACHVHIEDPGPVAW